MSTPEVKQAEVKQPTAAVQAAAFELRERVPSDWEISATGDDTIYARNNVTGKVFEGAMEDFNKSLRGQ